MDTKNKKSASASDGVPKLPVDIKTVTVGATSNRANNTTPGESSPGRCSFALVTVWILRVGAGYRNANLTRSVRQAPEVTRYAS